MTVVHQATGCGAKRTVPPTRKRIAVNGVVIPHAAIAQETQNHPASKPVEAWLAAAKALAVRELLLQEARRLAIAAEPREDEEGRRETDEEAQVRALVEQQVAAPTADDIVCRRYYDNNRARFRSPDLFEVRHILIAAQPGYAEARAEARGKAEDVVAALAEQPRLFAELAAVHSVCPSAEVGGNLGQIGPGQTVPEFEAALSSLPVGQVAPAPVETRYGFHVVLVERHIAGIDLPFEAVGGRIAAWLDERARRAAIRQYIGLLAGRAAIDGIELERFSSPLVQ